MNAAGRDRCPAKTACCIFDSRGDKTPPAPKKLGTSSTGADAQVSFESGELAPLCRNLHRGLAFDNIGGRSRRSEKAKFKLRADLGL